MNSGIIVGVVLALLAYSECYKTLLAIGILGTIACLLLYVNQNKILYMPVIPNATQSPSGNPFGYRHPSYMGLYSENIVLVTYDNLKLRGWVIKAKQSSRVIIYFHENAGNIGYRLPFAKYLVLRTNSDVILVAYRGYSDSEGIPTEEGLQLDAKAIFTYANNYRKNSPQPLDLYIYGCSLGGAVSIYLSSLPYHQSSLSGLILYNTFTNIADMIDNMPVLKYFKFLSRNSWNSIDKIPHIPIPILFIRAAKDYLVPTEHMKSLIASAKSSIYVSVHVIPNAGHNGAFMYDPDTYFMKFEYFLDHNQPS